MKIDTLIRRWYVLHTRSRFENVVFERLAAKSLESFLPKILVKSKRKDCHKMIHKPLFPGYVFVKTDLKASEHVEILKVTGAVRLIGNVSGPVPVTDNAISSLMIMTNAEESIIAGNRLKKGDPVMVVEGPFAGVMGVFSRYRGVGRVVVNVEVLGQHAAVEVDEEDVEPVPEILA